MDDKEIEEVLLNLGLKISKPPQAKEKFHILATPPQNFPILEIIRPQDSSRFYLIVMGIGIAPEHKKGLGSMKTDDRFKFLAEITEEVLKMGLDIAILPPGSDIPDAIQIMKVVYSEGLTPNEFLNAYYMVRNAGILVINRINRQFGIKEFKQNTTRYI